MTRQCSLEGQKQEPGDSWLDYTLRRCARAIVRMGHLDWKHAIWAAGIDCWLWQYVSEGPVSSVGVRAPGYIFR